MLGKSYNIDPTFTIAVDEIAGSYCRHSYVLFETDISEYHQRLIMSLPHGLGRDMNELQYLASSLCI